MNCDLRAIVIVLNQLYDMQVYGTLFIFLLNQKPLARFGYKDLNIIFFSEAALHRCSTKKGCENFLQNPQEND